MTADPGETPTGTADAGTAVDLTAAPEAAAADVPPELLAQSLGQYLRAWWLRVRSGNSGVLPVVLAMVMVAVVFEIITPEHAFLRPSNLVYIFGLSTVYMVLAMAETVVLLLAEIDLSVGAVALFGGVIAFKLVQQPGPDWPWWAAMLAALVGCGVVGALQGTLTARLKIPSFVVTLGGFLLFSGILIVVLGGADGNVNVSSSVPNQRVIYDLVQGLIVPVAGWVALAVVVVAVGTALWLRAAARRRQGLVAPPVSLTAIRIALVALVGVAVVLICTVNRGTALVTVEGVPWVIPIVLVVARRLDARCSSGPASAATSMPSAATPKRPAAPASASPRSASGPSRCARRPPASAAYCSVPFSTVSTAPIRQTPVSSSCTRSPPPSSAGSASSAAGARQSTVFSAASSSAASPTACPFSTWVIWPRRWNTSCRAACSSPRCWLTCCHGAGPGA